MGAKRTTALFLATLVAAGCGTGAGQTPGPTATPASSAPTATGASVLPDAETETSVDIPAGPYVTGASDFYPGLRLTLPDGWVLRQDNYGELKLTPAGKADDLLEMWQGIVAVVPNNQHGTVGQIVPTVGRTAKDLVAYVTGLKDLEVLEAPKTVTIGTAIQATRLSVGVSAAANFAQPECPDNPRCAAIVKNPDWAPDDFYAIGGNEVATFYIVDIVGGTTFWVVLDAPSKAELASHQTAADPILASLSLP